MSPPTKDTPLIKAALRVAKKYPVFPTNNKKPCWSNKELNEVGYKIGRGEGGYKIATKDPAQIKLLFGHRRATEIAVPMGEMSGLICIDVDTYKADELKAYAGTFPPTLTHKCQRRSKTSPEGGVKLVHLT